jgi:rhodanese-related sulfurtransferase
MRHLLLGFCLACSALLARADIIDIDNAELDRLVKDGVPLIDIRLQSEWEDTGIVGGSRLLTYFDERGRHDDAAWLEKLKPLARPGQPVILICRSGNRTRAASQFLVQQPGYGTVYNVKSGIKGWIAGGNPVVPAISTIAAYRSAGTC